LPGGRIHETAEWIVEHCVGPLGVGTLIVKPKRHIVHVWELDDAEAGELGPLLRRVSAALAELLEPDQVYVCLWSHAGGEPVHIHWVMQPVGPPDRGTLRGPHLQAAMFDRAAAPPTVEVQALAARLRARLA
jgi:diadenosine tetraphosphate (Ap4A) HIT family hydrolase